MERDSYCKGLREIADFFEAHPEVELPGGGDKFDYFNFIPRQKLAAIVRAFGTSVKTFDQAYDGSYEISRMFGGITFRVIGNRSNVCRRIVKGTKHVKEITIPERTIPAHDEDIVVWDCSEPILAGEDTH